MVNNIDEVKKSISLIIKKYRGEKSLREFAADLSSKTTYLLSYQTIKDWEEEKYLARYRTILPIAIQYNDWRRQFALDILAVLEPELYTPDQPRFDPSKGIS